MVRDEGDLFGLDEAQLWWLPPTDPDLAALLSRTEDDGTLVLELSVAEDDYGRIIGRGGRTANALRTVVKAAAVREQRRVLVDIVD